MTWRFTSATARGTSATKEQLLALQTQICSGCGRDDDADDNDEDHGADGDANNDEDHEADGDANDDGDVLLAV